MWGCLHSIQTPYTLTTLNTEDGDVGSGGGVEMKLTWWWTVIKPTVVTEDKHTSTNARTHCQPCFDKAHLGSPSPSLQRCCSNPSRLPLLPTVKAKVCTLHSAASVSALGTLSPLPGTFPLGDQRWPWPALYLEHTSWEGHLSGFFTPWRRLLSPVIWSMTFPNYHLIKLQLLPFLSQCRLPAWCSIIFTWFTIVFTFAVLRMSATSSMRTHVSQIPRIMYGREREKDR